MGRAPRAAVALLAFAAGAFTGCGGGPTDGDEAGSPRRAGRFGSLRDFVLFEWIDPFGRERRLFVDRFEVTVSDWADFVADPAGDAVDASSAARLGEDALPVGLINLRQARAFAAWRFARLPRRAEWFVAAQGPGGRNNFPWGPLVDATRANTAELGLLERTLVGTFESGRRGVGQPYDLVGNVSEWTETVPVSWCVGDEPGSSSSLDFALARPAALADRGLSLQFALARRAALADRALAVWQPLPGLLPAFAAVEQHTDAVPREVVGANFQSPMRDPDTNALLPTELVLAGDRRLRTGARLVTTPTELLAALLQSDAEPTALDYRQLERFVRRRGHLDVLRTALRELDSRAAAASAADTDLSRWLRRQLQP
ncbi:MAG: SUMF1/EgtB/PvdO family nonheme iron enzyme [Planctomycetes bacterium]|nr:SUMF1/EgtB/PvdO family nonheme iron enzyme [Planctomycetota bacterium]